MPRPVLRTSVRRRSTTPSPVRNSAHRKEAREPLACLGTTAPRIGSLIIVHADARCKCGSGMCIVTRNGLRCNKCGTDRIVPEDTAWTIHPLHS